MKRFRTPILVVCSVIGVAFGATLVAATNDDEPSRRMSLIDAACQELVDGRDGDFTVRVIERVAAEHPDVYEDAHIAALLAVAQARENGCGS